MMSRPGGKLNHVKWYSQNRRLAQGINPRNIRTFSVHLLEHLEQFQVVVVLVPELVGKREKCGKHQHQQAPCRFHDVLHSAVCGENSENRRRRRRFSSRTPTSDVIRRRSSCWCKSIDYTYAIRLGINWNTPASVIRYLTKLPIKIVFSTFEVLHTYVLKTLENTLYISYT